MSSHGRRGQPPGPDPRPAPEPRVPSSAGPSPAGPSPAGPAPAQLGWALLVIAAALIGGLAAAALVHVSITIAVVVSVVAGGVAVLATFRSPVRPPELRAGEPAEEDFGRYPALSGRQHAPPAAQPPRALRAVPPASFASAAADPTAPLPADPGGQARGGPPAGNQTVVQLLPLPPEPGNAGPPDAPWWDSAQGAPPPPSAGARRTPAPDLSTYLASTFIAQCPRCGAFRLDIRRAPNGWDFRCEACECTWTWQPGTPWPPVRVMPRGRPPAP